MLRSLSGAGPCAVRREGAVIVNAGFWRDRRVFVTGHTGFDGAWLCLWLERMGAAVTGYALSPATRPSLLRSARSVGWRVVGQVGDSMARLAVASEVEESLA